MCGAALAVGAFLYLQPPAIEPAVATAAVGPGAANIYANPSPGESVVASVVAGGQVNVLSLPARRGQEWIGVQQVTPSVSRSGYMRTNSLRDWHAKTAAGALTVARLMGSGESGTVEEMEAQADQLSEIGGRYAGDPAGRQARLEAAKLRLAAARKARDAGSPAAEWTPYLRKAQDDLGSLTSDPQLRDTAQQLSQQVADLLNTQRPITSPSPRRPARR